MHHDHTHVSSYNREREKAQAALRHAADCANGRKLEDLEKAHRIGAAAVAVLDGIQKAIEAEKARNRAHNALSVAVSACEWRRDTEPTEG